MIDGAKALRRAIKDVFGEHALVHRCHRHKERNATDLLPEPDRDPSRARIKALVVNTIRCGRPAAAAPAANSNRPWRRRRLAPRRSTTPDLDRLRTTGNLAATLSSTNPRESMIEIVRYTQRNVKR